MSDLSIELKVSVSDGSFESRLSFPVSANKEQIENIVNMWLQGMRAGLTIGQENTGEGSGKND